MAGIQIEVVEIEGAEITPTPCDINTVFKLSVRVAERFITLEPEVWYSGELYSGEV